ncbi:hypothetical protein Droror1_Dr00003336 [Drosera rotundifolia]
MAQAPLRCPLMLLTTLLILSFPFPSPYPSRVSVSSASTAAVGVNWGNNASHPLPAHTVVQLLKSNAITKLKLSDSNPAVLRALAGSNINVVVGVPNSMLETLNSSLKATESWVHDNVTRYVSGGGGGGVVRIEYIAVGDAPFLHGYGGRYVPFVIGAVINIQKALIKANLAEEVKVVVPCSYDAFLSESGLPSKGHFRPDLNKTMIELLTFLTKHDSPFLASISPFNLLQQDKNITPSFSLFKETATKPVNDTHRLYTNSFDLIYDTLVTAITSVGFPRIDIMIGEIGWPTDGAVYATPSNARNFVRGLLEHLLSKAGTPLRPHQPPKEVYILSLLDEDQRGIAYGSFERHWGLFTFDGQAKYQLDLAGLSSQESLVNAQNVEYLSARWCVADNSKDLTNATASALDACSSTDCSTLLSPGGSCFNLSWPANVSYAFNCYYQQHDQSGDGCNFGGLGLITTVDPSVDPCRFFVQIRNSEIVLQGYSIVLFSALGLVSFLNSV